jgi:hypothetical protein
LLLQNRCQQNGSAYFRNQKPKIQTDPNIPIKSEKRLFSVSGEPL